MSSGWNMILFKSSGWHDEIWVSPLDDLLDVISHPYELRQTYHVIRIPTLKSSGWDNRFQIFTTRSGPSALVHAIWCRETWAIIYSNIHGLFGDNWTLRNKLQWNLNKNSKLFCHENAFENVVCKLAVILVRAKTAFPKNKACCHWFTP